MKPKLNLLLILTLLMPGLLLAQDKPEKAGQKIVIIKKSVDEEGNEVVEKIVREGDGGETMEWHDEDGNVVIHLGEGDVEWKSLDDLDIDLEGLEERLHKIDVELEELNGLKNLKVIIEPDGEVIEWNGMGELPEELNERLEAKGLHFRSLDGEDFFFGATPNKAMLGVQVGQKTEVANEDGDVEELEVPEGEGAAVLKVFEGSAAEEAGIQKGDLITSIDGEPVAGFKALVEALSDKAPGDKVKVGLARGGNSMVVEATLKGREEAPAVYEFRTDGDGRGIRFFSDDDEHHGKRRRSVVIIRDGDVIINQEEGEEKEGLSPDWREGKPVLELQGFEAFPNPADGQLRVRFSGEQAPVTVMLLDAAGKQLYKEYIRDFSGKYDQQIGLEGVPDGLMLLTVEQEGKVFTEKVMIARQ